MTKVSKRNDTNNLTCIKYMNTSRAIVVQKDVTFPLGIDVKS